MLRGVCVCVCVHAQSPHTVRIICCLWYFSSSVSKRLNHWQNYRQQLEDETRSVKKAKENERTGLGQSFSIYFNQSLLCEWFRCRPCCQMTVRRPPVAAEHAALRRPSYTSSNPPSIPDDPLNCPCLTTCFTLTMHNPADSDPFFITHLHSNHF